MQGQVHPDFESVARVFRAQLKKSPGGSALSIWHRGREVVDVWGGMRADGEPWQEDTMALSFSTTKGVISTLLHVLVDEGALRYDDPVSRYWPEFAGGGKKRMTVREVMCHEAGLSDIRSMVEDASEMLDWEGMCDVLAWRAPSRLAGKPGYHAMTYGYLVGEIIRRVTGGELSELIAEKIARPLELDGLYCGLPESENARVAELSHGGEGGGGGSDPAVRQKRERRGRRWRRAIWVVSLGQRDIKDARDALAPRGISSFDWNAPEVWRAHIPAANGIFTARSLARMYAALCGSIDGLRLVSPGTFASLSAVQSRGSDQVLLFPMGWRLGYHRLMTLWGPRTRGFGHAGYGGSGAWCDPERGLAVGLTVNSGTGTPVGDFRLGKLSRVALQIADNRR